MARDLKAKEWALEAALIVFPAVALIGVLAGAELYVAVLRALAAGVAVAFLGRIPALMLIKASEAAETESVQGPAETKPQPRPHSAQAPARDRRAA